MANIASQQKRNSRTERERRENRHYTSAMKTYFRRLEQAVEAGDADRAAAEHREVCSQIDRAALRGSMHRRAAARRKAQAARILARV